jgi:hypothetical protein
VCRQGFGLGDQVFGFGYMVLLFEIEPVRKTTWDIGNDDKDDRFYRLIEQVVVHRLTLVDLVAVDIAGRPTACHLKKPELNLRLTSFPATSKNTIAVAVSEPIVSVRQLFPF